MRKTSFVATIAAITCATFGISGIANAETANVHYGDLNIASPAGAEVLHNRIDLAVAKVCGRADPRDLTAVRAVARCRADAQASSRSQVAMAQAKARMAMAGSGTDFAAR